MVCPPHHFLTAFLSLLLWGVDCAYIPNNAYYKSTKETLQITDKMVGDGVVLTRDEVEKVIGHIQVPLKFEYRSDVGVYNYLNDLAQKYPNLTKLKSIGKSVEGRELWVLVIGNNPDHHTPGIPDLKYVSNMHGNEAVSREMMLYFADVLLNKYGVNKFVTDLVNTTRIHILPSMNPDGFARSKMGTYLPQDEEYITGRQNSHGVDLNRNFPSRLKGQVQDPIQPETAAVIEWSLSENFVLSANFHGGTRLVNYPYDDDNDENTDSGTLFKTGDHYIFLKIADQYARAHSSMWVAGDRCEEKQYNDASDPKLGIVNGAEWYEVHGGMQDWNYHFAGCFEVTVELTCIKYPDPSQLEKAWNDNKYSLFSYANQIHNSIRGFVYDQETKLPLEGVTISIADQAKIIQSNKGGDYFRLINPGTYQVTFDHHQYKPVSKQVLITKEKPFALLDIYMHKEDNGLKGKDTAVEDNASTISGNSTIIKNTKLIPKSTSTTSFSIVSTLAMLLVARVSISLF
uniref:Peptidase_M14 domain-containing protein n=1 Tax=Rhabditophanes sp. KR3021 TaxID=114890 RepID=A0AC35TYX4_9BILA